MIAILIILDDKFKRKTMINALERNLLLFKLNLYLKCLIIIQQCIKF